MGVAINSKYSKTSWPGISMIPVISDGPGLVAVWVNEQVLIVMKRSLARFHMYEDAGSVRRL